MTHDVRHLKHRGSKTLCDKAAEFVFPITCNRESDHVAAAADRCGTGGKTGKIQNDAECSGADRQCQNHTHDDRNNDAHDERPLFRCPVDDASKACHHLGDRRSDEQSDNGTGSDGDDRCHDDINLGLAGNQMAAGDACESCDESAERFARSCQNGISVHKECAAGDLAGITADHGGDGCRNRDKRAFPIFHCHADTDTGTCQGCGSFSKQIDHISGRTADQKTDLLNHRTNNQGCKKTLRHAAEAINEDVRGDFFDCSHMEFLLMYVVCYCIHK